MEPVNCNNLIPGWSTEQKTQAVKLQNFAVTTAEKNASPIVRKRQRHTAYAGFRAFLAS
jgi:hypothetical protein